MQKPNSQVLDDGKLNEQEQNEAHKCMLLFEH